MNTKRYTLISFSMSNKKNTGSYYTPKILSDFLVNHILDKYLNSKEISILEPSCGDGQFMKSMFNNNCSEFFQSINLDLIDIDSDELKKAKSLIPSHEIISSKAYVSDYLKFHLESDKKYSLILGNPPYIKKENLKKEQIERCEKVHKKAKAYSDKINSNGKIKNIWPAFVEAAIMSLEDNGVLCFVIPAEVLQVKYAKELRSLIADEFDRVEVFAFNELIFEGIQQDVVAIIGVKGIRDVNEHGFSFYQVDELNDLKEPRFTEKHSNIHRTTLDKWTNYILSDEELNFVGELKSHYKSIDNYCKKAEVGIVSAANDYFILNDSELKENELNRFRSIVKPILPKGSLVPSLANFTSDDFSRLKKKDVKVNFLSFRDSPSSRFNKKIKDYLHKGEKEKLHLRYKMIKRTNWYHVPNTWVSEGLFVKRSHLYPKIFVNDSNSLATDSFYRIIIKESYNIKKLIFSFYNSLTFVLAELEGRFYGGGVLELTPNEFKYLSIPYSENIKNEDFEILDNMLRANTDIEVILKFTNSILLPNNVVSKLEDLRKKLVSRRLKNKERKDEVIQLKKKEIENPKYEAVAG
ncbi:MAG: N-6 DNA methylase [Bacteroidota bacterium]